MAAWTGSRSQQQLEDLWEGFARAHTWIYAEHSWWQLIPRLVEAAAPAGSDRLGFQLPCHVVTAYNPGGRAAADVDNQAAARALGADSRLDGLIVLPSVGGHPDGEWLEPGVAVIGLCRQQARALGRAYGQLAVYELQGATRWVIACGSDDVLAQTVVCHRGRQPPSPVPSAPPQPELGAGVPLLRERGRGCGGGQVQGRNPPGPADDPFWVDADARFGPPIASAWPRASTNAAATVGARCRRST
jgi:hypothetical protein